MNTRKYSKKLLSLNRALGLKNQKYHNSELWSLLACQRLHLTRNTLFCFMLPIVLNPTAFSKIFPLPLTISHLCLGTLQVIMVQQSLVQDWILGLALGIKLLKGIRAILKQRVSHLGLHHWPSLTEGGLQYGSGRPQKQVKRG